MASTATAINCHCVSLPLGLFVSKLGLSKLLKFFGLLVSLAFEKY